MEGSAKMYAALARDSLAEAEKAYGDGYPRVADDWVQIAQAEALVSIARSLVELREILCRVYGFSLGE